MSTFSKSNNGNNKNPYNSNHDSGGGKGKVTPNRRRTSTPIDYKFANASY